MQNKGNLIGDFWYKLKIDKSTAGKLIIICAKYVSRALHGLTHNLSLTWRPTYLSTPTPFSFSDDYDSD